MSSRRFTSLFAPIFFVFPIACGAASSSDTGGGPQVRAAGNGSTGKAGSANANGGNGSNGSGGGIEIGGGTNSGGGATGTGGAGSSTKGGPETCGNGLDDNGNGQADEGCNCSPGKTQHCFLGSPTLAGKGECALGTQTCDGQANGEIDTTYWSACTGSGKPTPETCDGKDNDCNGSVDDGCSCTEGSTTDCSTTCGKGTQVCNGGKLGACNAPQPSAEICDGKDNNCDGQIDEGLSQTCTNDCGSGVKACIFGMDTECQILVQNAEICTDGVDNNCDGKTDSQDPACMTGCTTIEFGTTCCQTGTKCCNDGTCPDAKGKCATDCAAVTCNGTCCAGGDTCCGDGSCPDENGECGTTACSTAVCADGCCFVGGSCCGDGFCPFFDGSCPSPTCSTVTCGNVCCGAGSSCCDDGSCPDANGKCPTPTCTNAVCGGSCCPNAGGCCDDQSCPDAGGGCPPPACTTVTCEGSCCDGGFECCDDGSCPDAFGACPITCQNGGTALIVLDRSSSMRYRPDGTAIKDASLEDSARWAKASDAVATLINAAPPDVEFGLELFPKFVPPSADSTTGCVELDTFITAESPHLPTHLQNAPASSTTYCTAPEIDVTPGPGSTSDVLDAVSENGTPLCFGTPTWYALHQAATVPTSFVILITDGANNCTASGKLIDDGSAGDSQDRAKLISGVTDLTNLGVKTIIVGFTAYGGDISQASVDDLNTMACIGGMPVDPSACNGATWVGPANAFYFANDPAGNKIGQIADQIGKLLTCQ